MRLLKSSFIILIILLTFCLCGCSEKKQYTKNVIEMENIYNQQEEKYYVYFYKDNCPYCDDCYEIINEYLNGEYLIKLYICDLSDSEVVTYTITYNNSNNSSYIKFKNNMLYKYSNDILSIDLSEDSYRVNLQSGSFFDFEIKRGKMKYDCDFIKDIKTEEEKIASPIKRFYEGEGGQGSSGGYFVDGVTNYNDLYISGVPSLIEINSDNISKFVVSGRKSIIEYFDNLIKEGRPTVS